MPSQVTFRGSKTSQISSPDQRGHCGSTAQGSDADNGESVSRSADAGQVYWLGEGRTLTTHQCQASSKNKRSISNKMDELKLLSASNRYVWTSGIMIRTESWLDSLIGDSVVQLTETLILVRWERFTMSVVTTAGLLPVTALRTLTSSQYPADHCSDPMD